MRVGLKDKVLAYHRANPLATSVEIGAALDCMPEYVRATFRRNGISLARRTGRRKCRLVLDHHVADALRPDAEARGVTVAELSALLLSKIARASLVPAVLDDKVSA
ncbi:MAG: hypothetical protein M9945_12510 [Aquamicrobium sp.]|uniref:hypothetical protein n=1 Tax=Aquamicrobium sp. TaxID=1872579 RepID=UPI00349EA058|nr:hypothetical protein [Aquamicrobium sp.]